MAKPRAPKKNVGGQVTVPAEITPTPVPTESAATATAPVHATQASQPETLQTEQKTTEPRKAEPKRINGKPEIVKTESRSNLVPINMDEEIRRFAYLLPERRGFDPGHEAEDWLAAETEIRQRYHQQSA